MFRVDMAYEMEQSRRKEAEAEAERVRLLQEDSRNRYEYIKGY